MNKLGLIGALSQPFFGWKGSPTKIDDREKRSLILTSLLEDLEQKPWKIGHTFFGATLFVEFP